MKTIPFILLLAAAPAFAANECASTPYRQLGLNCADIGLNTNRAVCRPGDRFARLCDDAVGGRVRTCTSNTPCGFYGDRRDDRYDGHDGDRRDGRRRGGSAYRYGAADGRYRGPWIDDDRWWRHHDRGRSAYYDRRARACERLVFDRHGNPRGLCAPGRINRDCRGSCETRSR